MKTSFVLGAAIAVVSIGAASRNLVATQSRVTDTAPLPGLGASPPQTTPPPGLDDIEQGLFKYMANPGTTTFLAPDNTCGWISARSASPYLCNSGDACGMVLPRLADRGSVMCFHGERHVRAHPGYVKCLDYSNYHASTDCGECHSENVVKCVSSDRPYCNTYYFYGGSIEDFRCESTRDDPINIGIEVETTWAGQTGSRTYDTYILISDPMEYFDSTVSELAPKSVIAASPTTSRGSGGDSLERDISKTSIDPTVATNRAPNGSSGLGWPPEIDMGRNNSGTPIGAIVGGVVGGVASLVAVVLITFFYLRRRKRRTAGTTEAPPSSRPLMQSTASPEMSMAQNQASSDSNPNDGSESLRASSASVQQQQLGVSIITVDKYTSWHDVLGLSGGDSDVGSSGGDNLAKDSSKTPVEAIVGGVVGGVAAIGAGLLIIFFCLRRRKSRTAGTGDGGRSDPHTQYQSRQPVRLDLSLPRTV
ncbi:hypothetical protein E4U09_007615 [Claviceps aff. purpurea]|uniref:Uncharacterized protein n=1 Tax=Claviceps aff. purpurea TaxID=1967640 RepID=A0A9P7QNZ1_9HYPO|nr:hypothetical protein E4U09_007615 [Claviceps aff. purpurea]